MTPEKKLALLKALRYWGASYALVAGFLYYKSRVTLGAIVWAGLATLLLTVARVWFRKTDTL